jgi:DnaK suppressor protein
MASKTKPLARKAVKAPAKKPMAAAAKPSRSKPAAAPVKKTAPAKKTQAPKAAAQPLKTGAPVKTAAAPAPKAPAKAPARPSAPAPVAALPTPLAPPVERSAGPKPQDVAAAHEYLLSRSATRSGDAVYVNGRRLPTEDELLKMADAHYMNAEQLAFFKHRLQQIERELTSNAEETTEHLRETIVVPDPADRATIEEEHALELRTRDRERKLLKKVQSALQRIDTGEYGFCEETGDPIGIPRLLARPTATLSLEAQQRRELKQKLFGD